VGGIVYLLEWLELQPGSWSAQIAWMEWDGKDWRSQRTTVPAADIVRIEDQNYKAVPHFTYDDMQRRTDTQTVTQAESRRPGA
jgi:hypothetical protein